MRDQFDISGVFETTEFEIAQVACIWLQKCIWLRALTALNHLATLKKIQFNFFNFCSSRKSMYIACFHNLTSQIANLEKMM